MNEDHELASKIMQYLHAKTHLDQQVDNLRMLQDEIKGLASDLIMQSFNIRNQIGSNPVAFEANDVIKMVVPMNCIYRLGNESDIRLHIQVTTARKLTEEEQ